MLLEDSNDSWCSGPSSMWLVTEVLKYHETLQSFCRAAYPFIIKTIGRELSYLASSNHSHSLQSISCLSSSHDGCGSDVWVMPRIFLESSDGGYACFCFVDGFLYVEPDYISMNGHTMRTPPHPVRSGKLNLIWPGQ